MTIDGLKLRDDCGMPCPICDKAAEFERAFGAGGIILCEHFVCRPCRARIERHCRVDRTISVIKVQPLESCSGQRSPTELDVKLEG